MIRRVAVRAVVVHGGKLLAVELKPYAGSTITGEPYWCTIGGGLDEGEDLVKGLEREVFEETGIKPVVGNLLFVQQFVHNDKEQLEFFFHVTNATDFLHVDLSKTSHGAAEIEKIAFIDPLGENVKPTFLTEVDVVTAAANPGPTQIFSYI